jgi:hypothetical protein
MGSNLGNSLVSHGKHVTEPHVTEPHVTEPHVTEPHVTEPHVIERHVRLQAYVFSESF